jgi:hypothetical protein
MTSPKLKHPRAPTEIPETGAALSSERAPIHETGEFKLGIDRFDN